MQKLSRANPVSTACRETNRARIEMSVTAQHEPRNARRRPALLMAAAVLCFTPAAAGEALNDAELRKWTVRFEKEVWPLLSRNGKDGCSGCHTARHRSTLRMTDSAAQEFGNLLVGGFLLPDDPGALLHVVRTPNPKTHMPPGKRASWTPDEIAVLQRFVTELDLVLNRF